MLQQQARQQQQKKEDMTREGKKSARRRSNEGTAHQQSGGDEARPAEQQIQAPAPASAASSPTKPPLPKTKQHHFIDSSGSALGMSQGLQTDGAGSIAELLSRAAAAGRSKQQGTTGGGGQTMQRTGSAADAAVMKAARLDAGHADAQSLHRSNSSGKRSVAASNARSASNGRSSSTSPPSSRSTRSGSSNRSGLDPSYPAMDLMSDGGLGLALANRGLHSLSYGSGVDRIAGAGRRGSLTHASNGTDTAYALSIGHGAMPSTAANTEAGRGFTTMTAAMSTAALAARMQQHNRRRSINDGRPCVCGSPGCGLCAHPDATRFADVPSAGYGRRNSLEIQLVPRPPKQTTAWGGDMTSSQRVPSRSPARSATNASQTTRQDRNGSPDGRLGTAASAPGARANSRGRSPSRPTSNSSSVRHDRHSLISSSDSHSNARPTQHLDRYAGQQPPRYHTFPSFGTVLAGGGPESQANAPRRTTVGRAPSMIGRAQSPPRQPSSRERSSSNRPIRSIVSRAASPSRQQRQPPSSTSRSGSATSTTRRPVSSSSTAKGAANASTTTTGTGSRPTASPPRQALTSTSRPPARKSSSAAGSVRSGAGGGRGRSAASSSSPTRHARSAQPPPHRPQTHRQLKQQGKSPSRQPSRQNSANNQSSVSRPGSRPASRLQDQPLGSTSATSTPYNHAAGSSHYYHQSQSIATRSGANYKQQQAAAARAAGRGRHGLGDTHTRSFQAMHAQAVRRGVTSGACMLDQLYALQPPVLRPDGSTTLHGNRVQTSSASPEGAQFSSLQHHQSRYTMDSLAEYGLDSSQFDINYCSSSGHESTYDGDDGDGYYYGGGPGGRVPAQPCCDIGQRSEQRRQQAHEQPHHRNDRQYDDHYEDDFEGEHGTEAVRHLDTVFDGRSQAGRSTHSNHIRRQPQQQSVQAAAHSAPARRSSSPSPAPRSTSRDGHGSRSRPATQPVAAAPRRASSNQQRSVSPAIRPGSRGIAVPSSIRPAGRTVMYGQELRLHDTGQRPRLGSSLSHAPQHFPVAAWGGGDHNSNTNGHTARSRPASRHRSAKDLVDEGGRSRSQSASNSRAGSPDRSSGNAGDSVASTAGPPSAVDVNPGYHQHARRASYHSRGVLTAPIVADEELPADDLDDHDGYGDQSGDRSNQYHHHNMPHRLANSIGGTKALVGGEYPQDSQSSSIITTSTSIGPSRSTAVVSTRKPQVHHRGSGRGNLFPI